MNNRKINSTLVLSVACLSLAAGPAKNSMANDKAVAPSLHHRIQLVQWRSHRGYLKQMEEYYDDLEDFYEDRNEPLAEHFERMEEYYEDLRKGRRAIPPPQFRGDYDWAVPIQPPIAFRRDVPAELQPPQFERRLPGMPSPEFQVPSTSPPSTSHQVGPAFPNESQAGTENGSEDFAGQPNEQSILSSGRSQAPELNRLYAQLQAAHRQLQDDLSRLSTGAGWQRYLKLPFASGEASSTADAASVQENDAWKASLEKFDKVARSPRYEVVAQLSGFQAAHSVLRDYVQRLGERQRDDALKSMPVDEVETIPAPLPDRRDTSRTRG